MPKLYENPFTPTFGEAPVVFAGRSTHRSCVVNGFPAMPIAYIVCRLSCRDFQAVCDIA